MEYSEEEFAREARKHMHEEIRMEKYYKSQVRIKEQIWKERQTQECCKCRRKDNLTLDHIVPKEIALQFGVDFLNTYWEQNFQLMCGICNKFKSARLDFANPKTKPLLEHLLTLI